MDYLPRFAGGPLREMQQLRRFQRKQAKRLFKSTRAPSGDSIKPRHLDVVFLYELEDFSLVHKRLAQLFQRNQTVLDRIEKIIDSEARLDGLSWSNLGTVATKTSKGIFASGSIRLQGLPHGIDNIQVSHHRLLPSLAAIQFSFAAPESLVGAIREESEKFRYPDITSSSLMPTRIFRGYTMAIRTDVAEAIALAVSAHTDQFKAWIARTLHLSDGIFPCRSVICAYEIDRSNKTDEFGKFCKENSGWLEQYGYDVHREQTYESQRIVLSPARDKTCNLRTESLFYDKDPYDQMDSFERRQVTQGIAVHSSTLAQACEYRAQFEHVRLSALKYLRRSRRKLHKSAGIVGQMSLTSQSSKRMATELDQSRAWSFNIWDGLGALRRKHFNNQISAYPEDALSLTKYNLEQVLKSSGMIAPAIQEQIDSDNISAMYTLQRRVFWLTIVSSLLAGIGLVGVWDKIRPVLSVAMAQITKLWA